MASTDLNNLEKRKTSLAPAETRTEIPFFFFFKSETPAVCTCTCTYTTSLNSVWSHLDMNSWAPTGDTPITAHLVNFSPLRDSSHKGWRRSVCWYVCLLAADYILACIDVRLGLLTIGTTQGERYARDVV